MIKANIKVAAAVVFLALSSFGQGLQAQTQQAVRAAPVVKAEKFFRTELYFGRSKPDGGSVSEDDWKDFLTDTVTPRFPDGFTSLKAVGQYREKTGRIVSEPSEVLIFFYPGRTKRESRAKIEEIRTAYVKRFGQESVLRVDLPRSVSVSF